MTNKPLSKTAYAKKIASAIKKSDRWFDKYVVLRDKKCIRCNSEEVGQCSHYYGKKACPELRYNLNNAHRMCSGCHLRHHKFDDRYYDNWMRHNYPEEDLDELERLSSIKEVKTIEYYEAIEKIYKEKVKQILGGK